MIVSKLSLYVCVMRNEKKLKEVYSIVVSFSVIEMLKSHRYRLTVNLKMSTEVG